MRIHAQYRKLFVDKGHTVKYRLYPTNEEHTERAAIKNAPHTLSHMHTHTRILACHHMQPFLVKKSLPNRVWLFGENVREYGWYNENCARCFQLHVKVWRTRTHREHKITLKCTSTRCCDGWRSLFLRQTESHRTFSIWIMKRWCQPVIQPTNEPTSMPASKQHPTVSATAAPTENSK